MFIELVPPRFSPVKITLEVAVEVDHLKSALTKYLNDRCGMLVSKDSLEMRECEFVAMLAERLNNINRYQG